MRVYIFTSDGDPVMVTTFRTRTIPPTVADSFGLVYDINANMPSRLPLLRRSAARLMRMLRNRGDNMQRIVLER